MTFYESLVLNTIHIISPIIIYLFFAAYDKNIDREENNIILGISLISSLYFLIKFGTSVNPLHIALIINIPLITAYLNKRRATALIISILIVIYNYENFHLNIYLLIAEYLFYYIMFYIFYKNKYDEGELTVYFIIINSLIFIINHNKIAFDKLILQIMIFIMMYMLVVFVLEKAKKVIKYHMTIKELEQEKQIRDSLFKITHEIKNPLAVCKGYLDMFDIENIEHHKKFIPILKEEIDKTLILLHDFLSFTKIKVEKDILDINLLLEEMIDNVSPLLKKNNIYLDYNIKDEEIYVSGDYNRLCQVMINVIKNSIEALEQIKNPNISITSKIKKQFVEIIISDNGCGIDEKDLENISKPFFTTKQSGTGLGVSMSLEIIKAHNGTMVYHSKTNEGTKVIIQLPLERDFNNNCAP